MKVKRLTDRDGNVFTPQVSADSVYLSGSSTTLTNKLSSVDNTLSGKADKFTVSSSTPTATWGGTVTVGTVKGTDLKFKMPANPDTDTHYIAKNVVASSSTGTSNVTAATSNPYLNLVENGTVRSTHRISGSGATEVKTDASGNITISSTNTTYSAGTDLGLSGTTFNHSNSGVSAGTYKSVTVNARGHVTAGTNPTTLSGYGITDAKIASGVITLGSNTITPLTAESTLAAGKVNGVLSTSNIPDLDASKITSGTISVDRLPATALERCVVVADDTARFALKTSSVQVGDTVKVTATKKMYMVIDSSKLSTEAGYEEYFTSTDWSTITNKPSSYTPSSHTHTKSQITDFPTSMPASDVYPWAKASTKPSYAWGEITDKPSTFTPSSHTQGEATLTWGGRNFAGTYGPVDSSMIPELSANRLAFGNPAGITIEYSRDGGSTWTDYGVSDNSKVNLFSPPGESFAIGRADSSNKATANYLLRVTINTGSFGVYTALNKFMIYCNTNGSEGCYCSIDAALESTPTNFVNFANKVDISGWSGYNIINTSSIVTYGNNSSNQYGRLRFTFGCTSGSTTYSGLIVSKIYGFGGVGWTEPSNLAKTGHIYSIGSGQSVGFPGTVSADGGFSGSLSGNATSSSSIAGSSQLTSADAVDSFLEGNKLKYATFTNYSDIGFGSNDGMIVSIPWSSSKYGSQLAFDDTNECLVKIRGKSDGTWGSWKQLWKEGDSITAPSVTATNGFTGDLTGNAATATSSQALDGFSRQTSQTWGVQTGTFVHGEGVDGCDWGFRKDCPVSGMVSLVVDGRFYQNEGQYACIDTSGGTITGNLGVNGTLNAGSVQLNSKVTLQYNSSTESLDFIFA